MKFDQFFLSDQKIIKDLITAVDINDRDIVLEIGPGSGNVTKLLMEKARKVIAIEIDQKFKPQLLEIPKLVVIFGDALDVLEKRRLKFNKIVSSLPSSIVEPLMFRLTKIDFEVASFLVPLIFVKKIENNLIFNAYFSFEMVEKVPKESFTPQPKTNWALVKIVKKGDVLKSNDYADYLIQYLFEHPKAKLKNALMEAVIKIFKAKENKITKNLSREIISRINFEEIDLDKPAEFNFKLRAKIESLSAEIRFKSV